MRWKGNRTSSNVDDRRGMSATSGRSNGSLIRLLPAIFRLLGFKGTAVVAIGIVGYTYFTGGNMSSLLSFTASNQTQSQQFIKQSATEKEMVQFLSVMLADTEDTWDVLFKKNGKRYIEPKLVLFRNAVNTACGKGESAFGPFYCPSDQKIYIDLSFYRDLAKRHKAPGDFAQAYVLAHEVGHHVQEISGILNKVHQAQARLSKEAGNRLSVKAELQADCFAGVWAHHANRSRSILENGDIEEGLTAASAIGDDRLQKEGRGYVTPESFTHGTSAQRVRWFKTGLSAGTVRSCNTFSAKSL